MPATIEAALIVLLLIAPGFLLQRGFQRGGTYAMPSLSLYAVTQAVVLSGVILLLSAPLGGFAVAEWLDDGTLFTEHEWSAWFYFLALLGIPFPLGLLIGRLSQTIAAPGGGRVPLDVKQSWIGRRLFKLRDRFQLSALPDWFRWLGFMASPTAWDRVWTAVGERTSPVMVEMDLGDDEVVHAAFGSESFVTTSPQPPGLFLEAEYVEMGDTLVKVDTSEGVYVDGSQIRSIRLYSHVPLEEQLWEEGPDPGFR